MLTPCARVIISPRTNRGSLQGSIRAPGGGSRCGRCTAYKTRETGESGMWDVRPCGISQADWRCTSTRLEYQSKRVISHRDPYGFETFSMRACGPFLFSSPSFQPRKRRTSLRSTSSRTSRTYWLTSPVGGESISRLHLNTAPRLGQLLVGGSKKLCGRQTPRELQKESSQSLVPRNLQQSLDGRSLSTPGRGSLPHQYGWGRTLRLARR